MGSSLTGGPAAVRTGGGLPIVPSEAAELGGAFLGVEKPRPGEGKGLSIVTRSGTKPSSKTVSPNSG